MSNLLKLLFIITISYNIAKSQEVKVQVIFNENECIACANPKLYTTEIAEHFPLEIFFREKIKAKEAKMITNKILELPEHTRIFYADSLFEKYEVSLSKFLIRSQQTNNVIHTTTMRDALASNYLIFKRSKFFSFDSLEYESKPVFSDSIIFLGNCNIATNKDHIYITNRNTGQFFDISKDTFQISYQEDTSHYNYAKLLFQLNKDTIGNYENYHIIKRYKGIITPISYFSTSVSQDTICKVMSIYSFQKKGATEFIALSSTKKPNQNVALFYNSSEIANTNFNLQFDKFYPNIPSIYNGKFYSVIYPDISYHKDEIFPLMASYAKKNKELVFDKIQEYYLDKRFYKIFNGPSHKFLPFQLTLTGIPTIYVPFSSKVYNVDDQKTIDLPLPKNTDEELQIYVKNGQTKQLSLYIHGIYTYTGFSLVLYESKEKWFIASFDPNGELLSKKAVDAVESRSNFVFDSGTRAFYYLRQDDQIGIIKLKNNFKPKK